MFEGSISDPNSAFEITDIELTNRLWRVFKLMNNSIPQTTVLCEKQIEQECDGLRPDNAPVLPAGLTERRLIWSSRKPGDWEILIYKQTDRWEACFFRWPVHHEHAIGSSFDSVRRRAEQRIRFLEVDRLRSAKWRQTIH